MLQDWVVVPNICDFYSKIWEMIQFDEHIFEMRWVGKKLPTIQDVASFGGMVLFAELGPPKRPREPCFRLIAAGCAKTGSLGPEDI